MSFDILSNEIVSNIFEWVELSLSLECSRTPLYNIALCSRRLNRLATPLLYRRVSPETWDSALSLLNTLLNNQKLGTFCKCFNPLFEEFDGYDNYEAARAVSEHSFHPDDLSLCKERIGKFCNTQSEVDRWLYGLEHMHCDASISLLLSFMPNVEDFRFQQYSDRESSMNRVLERAAMLQSQGSDSPFALSKLRSVHGIFDFGASLDKLVYFLRLKSLKRAEYYRTLDDTGIRSEPPYIELDVLVLGFIVDGANSRLDNFLGNFKTLRCFRLLEDHGDRDPRYEAHPYNLDVAISGLEHCLEELEIDQFLRDPEEPPWITSLADFKMLRKISISAYVLFKSHFNRAEGNIDVLPASLETLQLVDHDQYALERLLQILQRRQNLLPKLTEIRLKRYDNSEQESSEAFENILLDLKKCCKDLAIDLQLLQRGIYDGSGSIVWNPLQ